MTPLVAVHTVAAVLGVLLGAWQLFGPGRGSRAHRYVGRVWVAALLFVRVSSFWIREIRDGAFSLLHLLSLLTIVTVGLGVRGARRGDIAAHRGNMTGSWLGLLGAGVAASAVPSRDLPRLVVDDPLTAAVAAAALLTGTAAVVVAGRALADARERALRTGRPAGGSGRRVDPARPTAPRPRRGSRR